MKYGATVPPAHGGWLQTNNSDTGLSDRYCVHRVTCSWYTQSKEASNTVGFETDNINAMKEKFLKLPELLGGIKPCGTCLKDYINFSI
jgi:hypothetical protein